MSNKDDLAVLAQGKPYIRGLLAFVLRIRYSAWEAKSCYKVADEFIAQLERDVKDS